MNLEQLARALQSLDTQAAATVQKAVDEIAGLHTRVAELEAEIETRARHWDKASESFAKLEAERDRLRALLHAAEDRHGALVIEIRVALGRDE